MTSTTRIIILHETDGKPYFHALEQMARETGRSVEFYGASVFRRLLGAIPKRTISLQMLKESWINLLFRFRQFFIGEGVVVACFAPYDFRLLYFLPLWWNPRLSVIEHTSWPYWWTVRVPRTNWFLQGLSANIYYQWLLRYVNYVVTVLAEGKSQLATRPGLENKLVVIPHTNRMLPSSDLPRVNSLKVLYVGKLLPEKGIVEYLEVAKKLHSPEISFTIVGYGALRPLVMQAAENGFISFRENISDKRVLSNIYSQHDILVVPSIANSRWEELFGIVIIEAMAHGVVPITSNHIGPRNIITHQGNGIIMREGNVAEIEAHILELHANRDKLLVLREQARQAADSYSINAVAERWKALFDIIILNRKQSRLASGA